MQNIKMTLKIGMMFVLSAMTVCAQIPTWEERERDSGFNPEYQETWRSGSMRLPATDDPGEGEPDLAACYRKEFEIRDTSGGAARGSDPVRAGAGAVAPLLV